MIFKQDYITDKTLLILTKSVFPKLILLKFPH